VFYCLKIVKKLKKQDSFNSKELVKEIQQQLCVYQWVAYIPVDVEQISENLDIVIMNLNSFFVYSNAIDLLP